MPHGALSFDEAWLLGLIAGDGNVSKSGVKIFLGDNDEQVLAEEAERVWKKHGWPCNWTRIEFKDNMHVFTASGKAASDHVRTYAPFGLRRWRIPQVVLKAGERHRGEWVAGFIDADGSVAHEPMRSRRTVKADSVNEAGIDQVVALLRGLGIGAKKSSQLREPDYRPAFNGSRCLSYAAYVCDRTSLERLAQVVVLRCPHKVQALHEALASYQRDILLESEVDALLPEFTRRLSAGESFDTIATALEIDRDQVRSVIRTRELEGPGRGGGARHGEINRLVAAALPRIEAGETAASVARDLGVKDYTVHAALGRRGVKAGRRGGEHDRSRELAALVPQLRELVAAGVSNAEIAERLGHGLTRTRVAFILHKYGIHRTAGRGARKRYQSP